MKYDLIDPKAVQAVLQLFRRVKQLSLDGMNTNLIWFYKEDDHLMREMGKDFRDIFNLELSARAYSTSRQVA